MIKACSLLSSVLYASASFSQFSDTTHYYVNYTAAGSVNKANDGSSYIINNAFTFEISKKSISLNTSNSWVYGASGNTLTNNDFSSGLNFDLYKKLRTWYYWGLAGYTTSYSLQITNQFQTGLGVGHNTIKKKNAELVISDGILFETSDFYEPDASKKIHITTRNSLRIKYRWVIKNIIVLDGVHFWQPALTSFNNYIIKSANNLSVTLSKWLSITTSLSYNRFNQTRRENLLINFGLTFEKYF